MYFDDGGEILKYLLEIQLSTEGKTGDTGAVSAPYKAKRAQVIGEHSGQTEIGPMFTAYDSFSSSVLSGEF